MEKMITDEVSNKELYIPVAIPDSDDYISGIGQREVYVIAITCLITIVVGAFLSISINTIVGVGVGALLITSAITFIRRDIYNENFIKKIQIFSRFQKAQKKFIYVFKNEYKSDLNEDDESNE